MAERLQKILANSGLGSRRELEGLIAAGEVRVNGQVAQLGDRAEPDDDIAISGRFYKVVADERSRRRVLMYHKPLGEMSTRDDPEGRRTVFQSLPPLRHGRWISIGRLDLNTLGLLLFTNDGQLANAWMHPSNEMDREYAVRINGQVSESMLEALRTGVDLEDGPARFEKLLDQGGEGKNHWYSVTVREGRNRLVRRLWESQGVQVSRLIRTRFGSLSLPRWLPRGKVHELPLADVEKLARQSGLPQRPSDKLTVVPVHPRHRRRAKRKRQSA